MPRFVLTTLLLLTLLCLAMADDVAAKKKTLTELSSEILETIQSFYPVKSTEMGIHEYDHRLADYSESNVKNMIKKLTRFEQDLYRFKKPNLSVADRTNYHLLKSNLDIELLNLKRIRWYRKSPQVYVDEAVNGIYMLMLSEHASELQKVVSIVSRMKAVPGLFATARRNLKKPPPIYIEAALEGLESGSEFYRQVAGELMNKFPERADRILKVSTAAREAMNDFSIYLSEVTPGSETAFAIGKENFDYKLSNEYFLKIDSDSMLIIGQQQLSMIDSLYRDYEKYIIKNHQNGREAVFVPAGFDRQDLMDYYNWETNQVRKYLEDNDIVTVPSNIAPVSVIETPPFLRTMISGIAYQPAGPFDTIQHGYFYVRPLPEKLDSVQQAIRYRYVHRRGFRGSVVHEAYPGHHLQMQLAGMHSDPVRKWHYNLMMIEGWALYSEQMAYESGLFGKEQTQMWLAILGGARFRAARIVADVKLHTGQFTYDQCVDWMNDVLEIETESGREYIRKEVRRYTLSPTVQMSYLMGKLEIIRLRDAMRERDGDTFSLKDFHDRLLAEGSIPPALMWPILGLEQQ